MRRIALGLGAALALVAGCGEDGADGADGVAALLRVNDEPAGANCPNGGSRVQAGRDLDGDGTLDDDEVQSTVYVCDGEDGDNGDDGTNGGDGRDTLVRVSPEPAGAECAFGGRKVETGVDLDRDGELDEAEVTDTAYVCNGSNGAGTVAGFRLLTKYTAPGGPIAEIVSASADGTVLAFTSSSEQSIGLLDLTDPERPELIATVDLSTAFPDGEPTSVALTADGSTAIVAVKNTADPIASADPGALVFVDVEAGTVSGQVAIGVGPDSIHLTPDGTRAVVAIEDEEDADNNAAEQARPGSVQVVTLNFTTPSASTVSTIALAPDVGYLRADPQPEYVDITADGSTAIVSLQENNAIAVIDLGTRTVLDYIDAGTSVHRRADTLDDDVIDLSQELEGLLQPDSVCFLGDEHHFVSANEGDTPNGALDGLFAGGRGFSVFNLDGERVYDSGDVAELLAARFGAYDDSRSDARGIEIEGCGAGVYDGADLAFMLVERTASVLVLDASNPRAPVIRQILGAPLRPEGIATIPSRRLLVVGGEGDDTGGGVWIYEAVSDPELAGHGPDVYVASSSGAPFGALGALAYEPSTGLVWSTPDNIFENNVLYAFEPDHANRRMRLVNTIALKNVDGTPLTGYDPEAIAINPEGGFILATEGVGGNGSTTCTGNTNSNRVLFVDRTGTLDARYGFGGAVDLPCGAQQNAIDWTTVRSNGFEGVSVVDTDPGEPGGLRVYVAIQRGLTTEGQLARIGEYAVDTGAWSFWFYPLDANPGGPAGNMFLSELLHVTGDLFAVIERDQGWAGAAATKTIRTFRLSSGAPNDSTNPLDKTLVVDLLAHPFRFDEEKIEGLALGGGALWVSNDNDGGRALNYFVKLDPSLLGGSGDTTPTVPGQEDVVVNEVNSSGNDYVELHNTGVNAVDVGGWYLRDADETNPETTIPEGTTIPAGGFLLVGAAGLTPDVTLAFGLGSSDSITLYTPFDVPVSGHAWTAHVLAASRCAARFSVGGFAYWPTTSTLRATNDCVAPTVAGESTVRVNEVNSSGDDFLELYNTGAAAVDVSGWIVTDNDPTHVWVAPAGTTVPAGGVLLIEGDYATGPMHLTYGLGSNDSVTLYSPFERTVDSHAWTSHVASAGRCPNGTGAFTAMTASPGVANTCP